MLFIACNNSPVANSDSGSENSNNKVKDSLLLNGFSEIDNFLFKTLDSGSTKLDSSGVYLLKKIDLASQKETNHLAWIRGNTQSKAVKTLLTKANLGASFLYTDPENMNNYTLNKISIVLKVEPELKPEGYFIYRYPSSEMYLAEKPVSGNKLQIKYAVYTSNGVIIDHNMNVSNNYEMVLDETNEIKAWHLALKHIQKGEKVILEVPDYLAYGLAGSGKVPPSTDLFFYLYLVEILA